MEQIIVNSSVSVHSIGILGICIFGFLCAYLAIATSFTNSEIRKIKKAKGMIMEGHENAMNGRKDDGIFEETRKLREGVEETPSDDSVKENDDEEVEDIETEEEETEDEEE